VEWLGTNLGEHTNQIKEELRMVVKDSNHPTDDKHKQATKWVKERYLAILFLANSDPKKYAGLLLNFKNEYTLGTNKFPVTIVSTYEYIVNYKKEKTTPIPCSDDGLELYSDHDDSNAGWGRGGGHGAGHEGG